VVADVSTSSGDAVAVYPAVLILERENATDSPKTGLPFSSMTFALTSATMSSFTSRLGMDWGFAERSMFTGSVFVNSTVCEQVTEESSADFAVIVTVPVASFGP